MVERRCSGLFTISLGTEMRRISPLHRLLLYLANLIALGFLVLPLVPMVLGSLVYAIPGAVIAYPLTGIWLRRYRKFRAAAEGITYREWRARNVGHSG